MIENIKELIDDIVSEVAFQTDNGLVDFRKREHIYILSEVLTEMGLGGVKDELISALTEVDEEKPKSPDDDKYSHKAYGYYVRKGDEEKEDAQVYTKQDDGTYAPASTEDYEKAAAEQGEKGASSPASPKPKDGVVGGGATQQAEPEKGTALKDPAYQNKVKREREIQKKLDANDKSEPVEIEGGVDRKKFNKKSKNQKDAPNGPTQQDILDDLNNGNLDKLTEYQNEVEQNRALGIAGAGGAVASEGESKYCNACNLDKEQWRQDNKSELESIREDLKGKRRSKDEIRIAQALGFSENDDEFLGILAEGQLFCNQKTEQVAADKNSVLYKRGKKGFADSKVAGKVDAKGAYCDWMKAAYFGSITTTHRLKESRIDTTKPYKVVQSTPELDDSVHAHLEDMYTNAKTQEDKDYYKKQLELFKKFRTYHDTYAIGKDENGRTAIVSITNKKDSEIRDPHNNTTPAQRLRFIRSTFGENIVENVANVIDRSVQKVSDAAANTIESQAKIQIDDDIVRVCEQSRMSTYMADLDEKATNGTHKFSKFLMSENIDWDSLSTKERLEWMQKYANSRLYDKNGNSRIIRESYVNDEGDDADGIFYIDDNGKKIGPVKTMGEANIGLPFEPFGKIAIKLGEFGANEETKRIKQTEKNLVTEVHSELTNTLFDADFSEGGYHPERNPDADNGSNTQSYILGTMKAMHIDTYIDMSDDDDDAILAQMGINGVKPSMIRQCVADKGGFVGDISTSSGKNALKDFILKRCRVTPGGEKISIMDGSKEVELFSDQWRTAGTNQKVASYFGKDMRECLQEKAKFKR